MAFDATKLTLQKTAVGGGPQQWVYTSADAHATVEGAGYFAGMAAGTAATAPKGMRLNDVVVVIDTAAHTTTIHHVQTVAATGHCTINAATLA